jgi:hypothetical protein
VIVGIPEENGVAFVRADMVGDICCPGDAVLLTFNTERVLLEEAPAIA